MKKPVEYYLGLPYSVELRREPDEGWFVHVREWPGCMSQADTAEEALANIQEVIPLWLEGALESDYEIPEPRGADEYSGRFMVRVPRSLHRSLVELAEREAISLNLLVNVALAVLLGQERQEAPQARAVLRPDFAVAAARLAPAGAAETRRLGAVNEEKPEYNTAPTGKYAPLQMHLNGLPRPEGHAQLSFAEIERIIGDKLPPSARVHREWWSNHTGSHVQARAWLEAGWEVDSVDREAQTVCFQRITANSQPAAGIAGVGENDVEETVAALRRAAAEHGTNKLSAAEIEAEIAYVRRERRAAPAEE